MPVAAIAVSMLIAFMVATPSDASPSCMSKTEARQRFVSMHLYWHGRDHCWVAAPTGRRTQIHKTQRDHKILAAGRRADQPNWHDSMSAMLPDDSVQSDTQTSWINRWVDIQPSKPSPEARWVEIAQVKLPSMIQPKRKPVVSPHVLLLALISIGIALTLATIEFLFRRTAY